MAIRYNVVESLGLYLQRFRIACNRDFINLYNAQGAFILIQLHGLQLQNFDKF